MKAKKPISLPRLKKRCLDLYSELVKLRAASDGKLYCYTCSKPLQLNSSDCQLGHFLSRGAYPGLTFHPDNSRIQDFHCNIGLKGNTVEFRIRLVEEIGIERVEALESIRHTQVKWSRSELHDMIDNFSSEIKELKTNF